MMAQLMVGGSDGTLIVCGEKENVE
jgi:hypothetical protein